MNPETKKSIAEKAKTAGLVAIAHAEDKRLAKDYKQLLEENDVPTTLVSLGKDQIYDKLNIAIMVSEELYDKAFNLIQSRNPGEYFFDSLFNPDPDDID